MVGRAGVQRRNRREQSVVGALRRIASFDACRDHDRHELRRERLRRRVDHEAVGQIARFFLVWHHRQVARQRAAKDAGEPSRFFRDVVRVRGAVPRQVARHRRRGPHQPQARTERRRNRERQHAAGVQQDHEPRLVDRREHDLANRERGVRVHEGRRLGPHDDRRHDAAPVDVERITFEPERQREAVGDLHRVHPRFRLAVLVPEHRSAAADDVEERAGMCGARQLQSTGSKREFGDGRARRRRHLRIDERQRGDERYCPN